jgi:F-type H+-transporting ATPase subunit b
VRAERPSGEREILERLRGDEAALEREIVAARTEAARLVEAARAEAARIAADTRRTCETERDALCAAAREALEQELTAARAAVAADVAALAPRAERNLPAVLARVVVFVLGEAP